MTTNARSSRRSPVRTMFALALVFGAARAAFAQTCKATYRPQWMDTEGEGDSEGDLARLQVTYLEITSANTDLYVKVKDSSLCTNGYVEPEEIYVYFCQGGNTGGGDYGGNGTDFDSDLFGNGTDFDSDLFGNGTDFDFDLFGNGTDFDFDLFGNGTDFDFDLFGNGTDVDFDLFGNGTDFDFDLRRRLLSRSKTRRRLLSRSKTRLSSRRRALLQEEDSGASCEGIDGFLANPNDAQGFDYNSYLGEYAHEMLNVCCPADKPNFYLAVAGYDITGREQGRCTSAVMSASYPYELTGPIEDAVAPEEPPENLFSLKDVWKRYESSAAEVLLLQAGLDVQFGACPNPDVPLEAFAPLPPFKTDVVSTFFTHLLKEPVPGNDEEVKSELKLTPFSTASAANVNGTCRLMVTLADHPDLKPMELVGIDGVDFECLKSAYKDVPDAYVALDALTALAQTSKAYPSLGDTFDVTLRDPADESNSTHAVRATYSAYKLLKVRLDKKNDDSMYDYRVTSATCGGMSNSRRNGEKVTPAKTCPRVGVNREINVFKDVALDSMVTTKLGTAVFGDLTDLKTGRVSEGAPIVFDDVTTPCTMTIRGLYDADGNDACAETMTVERATSRCSFEPVQDAVAGMNEMLSRASKGLSAISWDDFVRFTGRDAFVDCMEIVSLSMTDAYENVTLLTDECTLPYPETSSGIWSFCESNPNHEYCADPCCNIFIQDRLCCAPKSATVSRFRPTFDSNIFTATCMLADTVTRGSVDETLPVANAIPSADRVASKISTPETCLAATSSLKTKLENIKTDLDCCVKAVIGEWDHTTMKYASTQPCQVSSDCFSDVCVASSSSSSSSNSQGSSGSGSSDSCWSSSSGNSKCAVANSTYVGEALAKCLTTKLRDRDYLREIAILKSVIGGRSTATDAEIGAAILEGAGYYTCEGSDGYKYDPFNDCPDWEYDSESGTYECKRYCEGVEDCKDKCLNSKTCNWKAWEYSDDTWGPTSEESCLDEDLGENFCAATNEWGGVEDLTEFGYCSPTAGIVDEFSYGWYSSESSSITNELCQELNSTLTAKKAYEWSDYKRCQFPTAMSQSTAACFDGCSSDGGFKPPALYECYVSTNSQGACPSSEYFTERRVDWDADIPWELPRPSYCVTNIWGNGGLYQRYGYPDDWASNETKANWTITLTGDLAGSYKMWKSEWTDILGHKDWSRGFVFAANATAQDVCTQLGAKVRLLDDGTQECRDSVCWYPDVTTETECVNRDVSNTNAEHRWRQTFREGAGACFSTPAATLTPAYYNITFTPELNADDYWSVDWSNGASVGLHVVYCDKDTACTKAYANFWSASDVPTVSDTFEIDSTTYTIAAITATPQPKYESFDDSGNLRMAWCYENGYSCYNGQRDYNDFDYTNYSTYSKPGVLNTKASCEANGGVFYLGKNLREGKFDSASKCSGAYCNVAGPRYSISEEMCSSIGGQCRNSQGCNGCRAPYWGEVDNVLEGMCYTPNVPSASNCTAGAEYDETLRMCLKSDVKNKDECTGNDKWVTCEDVPFENCTAPATSSAESSSIANKAAKYLSCRRDKAPKHCSGADQCASEGGSCWGPDIRDQVCFYDSNAWTCEYRANVCVTNLNQETWSCPGATSANGYYSSWDERRYQVNDKYCLDYYAMSETACDDLNGTWTSTSAESREQFCTASKRCEGGSSEWGVYRRQEDACLECGGEMVSDGTWVAGSWFEPAMVRGGRSWKARAMEVTNTWSVRIDEWRVRDFVEQVRDTLDEEAQTTFLRCMYAEMGDSIEKMASICGGAPADIRAAIADAPFPAAEKTIYPGAPANVGIKSDSNVAVNASTFNDTVTITTGVVTTKPLSDSPTNAAAPRLGERRLAEGGAVNLNAAGCWSVVKNANDKLVGQLLGDCLAVNVAGAGASSGTSGVEVCLVVKSEREVADAYTQFGFAKRTGSTGSFSYMPTSYVVKSTGTHLCATVTEYGAYVCPVKLAPSWASSTVDVGSSTCEATQAIAQVAAAKVEEVKTAAAAEIAALPPCDASKAPTNGAAGDCTATLASGSQCQPVCDMGYAVSGPSKCNAAKLTAATCAPLSCDASEAPVNGAVGTCTNALAHGASCQPTCDAGYTVSGKSTCTLGVLDAATCVQDSKLETSVTFSGISEDITDEIEAKLLEAMKTAVRDNGDFTVGVSSVQRTYVVSGSMSFASAPTTSAFTTAAATALGLDPSAITNVQGTSARRRLLVASVTYDVSSTTRAQANTLRATARAATFAVGGVPGTSPTASTSIKVDATIYVPASKASAVSATLNNAAAFSTSAASAAVTATGIAGIAVPSGAISVAAAPCDASTAPTNGAVGTCTATLASGSQCQPVCNTGYTVSGASSCSMGSLNPATCAANSCDASATPANGAGMGNCTATLASGMSCAPQCNSGYVVNGLTSCTAGTTTSTATCVSAGGSGGSGGSGGTSSARASSLASALLMALLGLFALVA